jgi:hypothetical protein
MTVVQSAGGSQSTIAVARRAYIPLHSGQTDTVPGISTGIAINIVRASSVDPKSCFNGRYLTLCEVIFWIHRREPQRKGIRLTFAEAISSSNISNYSDVIAGRIPPRSKDVDALCQLHAALEQGLLIATGRRCAKGSPRLLPAYYWPRLVFYNRGFRQLPLLIVQGVCTEGGHINSSSPLVGVPDRLPK